MRSPSFLASAVCCALLPLIAACASNEAATKPPPAPDAGSDAGIASPLGDVPGLPVDATLVIQNLSGPVDVVRDKWGRPHIYATSMTDAMRVEGYFVAWDRTMQLEFFRRVSEGRLAELLSDVTPSVIDLDISYRHIGLARAAQAEYAAMKPGPLLDALEAYSDGITQAYRKIRSGAIPLPAGIAGSIPTSAFTDWTAVDSLAIGRLETYELSYDADSDVANQVFFEAARSTFTATDPDPLIAKRAGLERDLFRFAPADPTTTTTGYPVASAKPRPVPGPVKRAALAGGAGPQRAGHVVRGKGPLSTVSGYLAAMHTMRRMFTRSGFGSNNWSIAPSRSATGHTLIASDPHLSLSAPSVFWPVSIQVKAAAGGDATQDIDVGGLAFPGIPAIILGHNADIGWGATVAGYDVSDAYSETLTADGKGVIYKGQTVPIQIIDEVIQLQSGPPLTYAVQVVPQHGPILPNIVNHQVVPATAATGAISIKWTGMQPTNELEAVFNLLHATNVDTAYTALLEFGVGAQNWMIGDTSGNILWTSHALVPTRDRAAFQWDAATYQGNLPCFVLPGDGTAEWTGFLPDALVPWLKNPPAGYMSTANNDPIGNTLDNDPSNDTLPDGTPMYLACTYDLGFREGKIHKRIEAHTAPLQTTDLSTIQGDETSSMGINLAPALVGALERAIAEKKVPGTYPDLTLVVSDPAYDPAQIQTVHDLMAAWGTAGYLASSGVDPDNNMPLAASGSTAAEAAQAEAALIFNAWHVRLLNRTFDDELGKMNASFNDPQQESRAILRLVNGDAPTFATYDPTTGDSSLWDDLGTPTIVESRYDRMVRALLDALGDLATTAGTNLGAYRWGSQHTITFEALLAFWSNLSIPPASDPVFGSSGFPRHGDLYNIDAADYDFVPLGTPFDFTYGAGPTQRFVVDLDPSGPRAWNTLPGGEIWNPTSPHFRDEAELWRRNEVHPVPYLLADVVADKESRTLVTP